jgi:2-polyprenyl-3-methyl-5-hydroxy-6-metoxy-1,4-benzoquinol methylase
MKTKAEVIFLERIHYLQPYLSKNALILDFGCGRGIFVRLAKKFGYQAFGYDIDPKVSADYYSLKEIPNRFFEAVVCFDVIEHVDNPQKLLKDISKKLKINGLLLITTPNRLGITGRIIKNKFWGLAPGGHKNIFTISQLQKILKKAGFKIIQTKTDIISWWYLTKISWLNRLINKIVFLILFPWKKLLFRFSLGDNIQILARLQPKV